MTSEIKPCQYECSKYNPGDPAQADCRVVRSECGTYLRARVAELEAENAMLLERARHREPCGCDEARDTLQQQLTAAERHGDILVGEVDAMQRQLDEARELSNRIYPCDDCGKLRSKAEGGTVFTICDECWDRHRAAIADEPKGDPDDE